LSYRLTAISSLAEKNLFPASTARPRGSIRYAHSGERLIRSSKKTSPECYHMPFFQLKQLHFSVDEFVLNLSSELMAPSCIKGWGKIRPGVHYLSLRLLPPAYFRISKSNQVCCLQGNARVHGLNNFSNRDGFILV
jgi:hypothetical protein